MALRIHAEQRARKGVVLHPTSHLVLHEQNGYQQLWGLQGHQVGQSEKVLTIQDLKACDSPERLGALVLELPMREIGGQLPTWEELKEQVAWAREHDLAVHLDGARLWQCEYYYQRSFAEICALFDSVYVSFYKDLGGIAGAVLAGATEFVAQARVWSKVCRWKLDFDVSVCVCRRTRARRKPIGHARSGPLCARAGTVIGKTAWRTSQSDATTGRDVSFAY